MIVNDGTDMKQINMTDLKTYLTSNLAITSSMITDGTIQEADLADGCVSQAKLAPDAQGVPSGAVMAWPTNTAPNGWLLCYGQDVSRTTYSTLYAAIGTTYGSNDSTTFTLPDLRGRVIAGKDDMGGAAAGVMTDYGTTLGGTGGSEHVALTESELAAHRHLAVKDGSRGPTGGYTALTSSNSIIRYSIDPDYSQPQENATSYSLEGISGDADIGLTSQTGTGQAHENTQPTMILNYIIKI
jgi:microcystin-dependent protein